VSAAKGRKLEGQHAVVTGGSRGIGAEIARALAARGAGVTVMARDERRLTAFCEQLAEDFEQSVCGVSVDMCDAWAVADAFTTARETLGPPTILVNNAGGAETAPFQKTDLDMWERMIKLNLTSAYLASREVFGAMMKAGGGRIVNIASTAGVRGYAYVAAYTAAKHGLVGLTRSLALEATGTGVKVNVVCPGYADTDMTRDSVRLVAEKAGRDPEEILGEFARANAHGRLVKPDEVARAVVGLCDPSGSVPTGEVIMVDGSS
jgi:NAD(P)-dependent dehydrogenase (short-subunit alcohol dehydrogenase family)